MYRVSPCLVDFVLPGAPVPASRSRFRTFKTKAGKTITSTYYAGAYKTYLAETPKVIAELLSLEAPIEGALAICVDFYLPKPKTTKLSFPAPDLDNPTARRVIHGKSGE